MTDLAALQDETLAAIGSAPDEPALEAVRVAALGKKGSVSALLATLGKLSPDERKSQGAASREEGEVQVPGALLPEEEECERRECGEAEIVRPLLDPRRERGSQPREELDRGRDEE